MNIQFEFPEAVYVHFGFLPVPLQKQIVSVSSTMVFHTLPKAAGQHPDRAGQPGLPLLETAAGVKASAGFLGAVE